MIGISHSQLFLECSFALVLFKINNKIYKLFVCAIFVVV